MPIIDGRRVLSGTYGRVWYNGDLWIEVQQFEAKVTAEREDVQIGLSIDTKINALRGEGTMRLLKVYTRTNKRVLEDWKAGRDPRGTFISAIDDPDAAGGQDERIQLDNVWFNEMTLLAFEKGVGKTEQEVPFGFTPSEARYLDIINVV